MGEMELIRNLEEKVKKKLEKRTYEPMWYFSNYMYENARIPKILVST